MASTAISGYTRRILVSKGVPGGIVTMRAGGAEIYPGHCVTCEGNTWPDVMLPDANTDSVFGIASCPPDKDIDTVLADNSEFDVYLCGSGAIVYGYRKGADGGGDTVAGDIMVAYGIAAAGSVVALKNALQDITGDCANTVMATQYKRMLAMVGRAVETLASSANTVPIKMILSV